ncbi:HK97-gp10 family putative phage morphogenesis protein [Pseudomonas sp. B26(2017)]|uniref:HK97-gp10 family putative phage morphogenesis protein n=1 Tax=Pseudomonas sp. B26(2017) TaxID=1981732 RepID=UPI000A1F359F|nr:HK97-gp10 family putative phage morphogenesis protein [Pseudomonas sp. B26(2017)]
MADGVEFSITGLDSLLGKLGEVKQDVRYRGGRAALRRATQVVVKKAQEGAEALDDKETGRSIASNIALRWNGRLFKSTGNLGFRVGVLKGAVLANGGDLASGSATPHWRLLEFGTEKMAAKPFMRPAIESSIGEVTNTFAVQYEKNIDRAINRARKATLSAALDAAIGGG